MFKDDKGAAVSLMGIVSIFLLLLIAGTVIDVSKNYQTKISLQDAINDSATAAISEVHQSGSLRMESIDTAIDNYIRFSRPTVPFLNDKYPTRGYNVVLSRSNSAVGGMGGDIAIADLSSPSTWPKTQAEVMNLAAKKRKQIDKNNSDTITIYVYEEVPNYLIPLLGPNFKTQKIMVKGTATTLTADGK